MIRPVIGVGCFLAAMTLVAQPPIDDCALAEALFNQAEAFRARGTEASISSAIEDYEQAIPLWRAAGDRYGEGEAFFYLGLSRAALGDRAGALEAYLHALPLRREGGDRTRIAQTLNNIGVAYDFLGEDQTALLYYRQSLDLKRELGDVRGQAATLGNIGLIYASFGETEEALVYQGEALALRRAAGDRAGQGFTLHNIGQIYSFRGQKAKALDYFEQSLAIRRETKDRRGEAVVLNGIGSIYSSFGQQKKALRYLDEALAIKRETGDRLSEAYTLQALGSVYRSLGDRTRAMEAYRGSLEIRHSIGQGAAEALTLASIAHLQRDEGNLDASRESIEAALAIVETLRSKFAVPDVRASYFATKKSYYDFYIDLLMRLHRRDRSKRYDVMAFETSERARGRSLLEIVREAGTQIREGADPELLHREMAIRRLVASAERRRAQMRAGKHEDEEVRRANEELGKLLAEGKEIEAEIRLHSPRYAALTQPAPLTLSDVQHKVLDGDTILLEYALGKERSFLWLVTTDRFATFVLPPKSVIVTEARRCYDLLTNSERRSTEHEAELAATKLGSMILSPVAGRIGHKRLLIVADGALQIVPFAALRIPRTLLEDHEIVSIPSASVLAVLRRELEARPPAPKSLAILADPEFGSTFQPLRSTRREAEQIARLTRPADTLTALGPGASRDLAMSGQLANYRVVHFATHGLIDDRHPELSGIALSGGLLRMYDVYNLHLNADLVVLSACQTALGKEVRGEGLVGLVRAFMYAGSSRVVASLWKVKDEATAHLMGRFYEAMARGSSPADALHAAQLAMLRDSRWQAPYYWAGFILQGDWRSANPSSGLRPPSPRKRGEGAHARSLSDSSNRAR